MAIVRRPFQGVINIVRFNWHFYLLSLLCLLLLISLQYFEFESASFFIQVSYWLISVTTFLSIAVSYYIYDYSELYSLSWLSNLSTITNYKILNLHAGFDETSNLISDKFRQSELMVLDFYNPMKHTEVSIKRARKAYLPFSGTVSVSSDSLPVKDNSMDIVFVIFSAHEIRDENERIQFFKELKRILKPDGQIILTEHLRDIPNFIAYTIGFLHFYSSSAWHRVVSKAGLYIASDSKITPFVTTFIVKKYGIAS